MKTLKICLLLIASVSVTSGVLSAQVARLPDCFLYFNLDGPESSGVYDNRQVGCVDWSVALTNDGFAALTVTVEEAPDAGGSPGAFVIYSGTTLDGVNPLVGITADWWRGNGYRSYVRVTSSGLAGAGNIRGILYGYRATDAASSSGVGVVVTNTPLPVQGAETEGAAATGDPVRVSGWDGVNSYTLSTDTTGKLVMSPDSEISISTFSNGPNLDAFSRFRTSQPITLSDVSFVYDLNPLKVDTLVTGGATVTHIPAESSVRLEVTVANGDRAVVQNHQYQPYQSGRSQLIIGSVVFGTAEADQIKRAGYYDDDNGLFFQESDTGTSVCVRSSVSGAPVDVCVPQASWNLDPMDGTGPSGQTLDITKAQIILIDLQWLGVGRVRFGLDLGGVITYVHEVLNANTTLSTVYMQTAALPYRGEIVNTAATVISSMDLICWTITRESGPSIDEIGTTFTANNGVTVDAVTTREPVLCIRPKATFGGRDNHTKLVTTSFSVYASANILWEVVYRPTSLTGASWVSVDTNSAYEYDVSSTAITAGTPIDSGYAPSGPTTIGVDNRGHLRELGVTLDIAGVQDALCVVTTSLTGSSNVTSTLTWAEHR